jgi:Zn-dependent protease
VEPEIDEWDGPHPQISFGRREIRDLLLSSIVLSVGMALVLGGRKGDPLTLPTGIDAFDWPAFFTILPFAALATIPAFILHELAHKLVAQKKDLAAEFLVHPWGLSLAMLSPALFKILLAAPGVVEIYDERALRQAELSPLERREQRRDAGLISVVGPMVNLILAYAAFLLDGAFRSAGHIVRVPASEASGIGNTAFELIMLINVVLAAFNMLPINPFDGRKILRWSWGAFLGVWALIVTIIVLAVSRAGLL